MVWSNLVFFIFIPKERPLEDDQKRIAGFALKGRLTLLQAGEIHEDQFKDYSASIRALQKPISATDSTR